MTPFFQRLTKRLLLVAALAAVMERLKRNQYRLNLLNSSSIDIESYLTTEYDGIRWKGLIVTSFPNGFILNSTQGTVYLASTLTDPKIQNITTLVTLTNEDKSEKYSNDVRSDLDMRAILPKSLPALNETPAPSPSASLPTSAPSTSAETNGEDQEDTVPSDDSDSDEE